MAFLRFAKMLEGSSPAKRPKRERERVLGEGISKARFPEGSGASTSAATCPSRCTTGTPRASTGRRGARGSAERFGSAGSRGTKGWTSHSISD